MARDPLGVVAHLAPGLSQVGPHAGDVGGQGAHVGAHRRDEGIHAPAMIYRLVLDQICTLGLGKRFWKTWLGN